MTHSAYIAWAESQGYAPRESPFMGLSNPAVAGLRCFRRYSSAATTDITDPWGKTRWLSPKQARIYAILDRASSSTSRLTMTAIASEAMVCTSTVSRTVQKLQAFGLFAIDVTRGRHGGISVRKRHIGDHLKHYADAAWKRIRSWINVASTHKEGDEGYLKVDQKQVAELKEVTTNLLTTYMDATFSEAWDAAEERGRILARERDAEAPVAPLGQDRGFDPGNLTAENVVAERRWLDANDPDWDLVAEEARARWLN